MGGFAARKALEVVKHVEQVLAIELLAACQALEFHRPKTTTAPLEAVHKLVRTVARYVVKKIFFAPPLSNWHLFLSIIQALPLSVYNTEGWEWPGNKTVNIMI